MTDPINTRRGMNMIGLEKITNKIIEDANAEAARIISDAEARCAQIALDRERKKTEIKDRIYNEALNEGEEIKMRTRSGVAMEKRDIMLSLRSRLIDEVFERAVEEIISTDSEKYRELLTRLLCKVLGDQLESERESMRLYSEDISPEAYEVIMNKNDRELHGPYVVAGVRRATVGRVTGEALGKLRLSDKVASIEGGLILKCGDIEINCAISTIAAGLRAELEAEVSYALFPPQQGE